MAKETTDETITYHIVVRGPNGEEEQYAISPKETVNSLKQRIGVSPKFITYTAYHLEVENNKGGEDLILDDMVPFSGVPIVGEGSTLLVVPDLYNAKSIRFHIKYSIALLSNRVPLISQIIKLNGDQVPESLIDYAAQMADRAKKIEEKKEVEPLDLKERLNESMKQEDGAFKDIVSSVNESIRGNDLDTLAMLNGRVSGDSKIAIRSLSLSSYNPPTASRLAMGDFVYLRMHTVENNVFHITGNASGFFANKSTDSVFDPTENSDFPTVYPTLPAILCSLSSGFKSWYLRFRQVARSSNLLSIVRSLPLMPNLKASSAGWFGEAQTEESGNLFQYADVMMENSMPVAQLKTMESTRWMGEYTMIKELASEVKTSLMLSKEQAFAAASMYACQKIVDEGLPALLLGKDAAPCFIVEDIFITSVATHGTDVISMADCNDEINTMRFINGLQLDGLFSGLTAVVDYKGHRFLAQSTVPGVMAISATNMVMWGSVDEGATIYHDARVKAFLEKMAEEAHWSESKVHAVQPTESLEQPLPMTLPEACASTECLKDGAEGTLLGPVEGRIVRGSDNRLYAVDFLHVAPVDVAWLEAHKKLFPEESEKPLRVRRQLVIQWIMRMALLKQRVESTKAILEKKEKGEEVEDVKEEDVPKLKELVASTEKELASTPMTFDVNAFTSYAVSDASAESAVRELCAMISDVLVPSVATELDGEQTMYVDTENIVALVHSMGLNVRYLGALASAVKKETAKEEVEREMVARAAKHVLREVMEDEVLCGASAFTVTAFLNGILNDGRKKEILLSGKNKKSKKVPSQVSQHILKKDLSSAHLWDAIDADVKRHFHYDLTIWGKKPQSAETRFRLLRRICQQSGIRLQAQSYNLEEPHVIRVENVLEFVPRVKFASTPNVDQHCSELQQGATSLVEDARLPEAYEVAKRCLIQVMTAHSQLHPQCLPLLNLMTGVLLSVNDIAMAIECSRAALYCSDRINGCDSLESAKLHTEVASLLYRNGCFNESVVHNLIAVGIYKSMYGEEAARVKMVLLNLGMAYIQLEKREDALRCMTGVMTLNDANSDVYLNACFYACVLNAVLKKSEEAARCKKLLAEGLADKDEAVRKAMMESLEKQLKEIH